MSHEGLAVETGDVRTVPGTVIQLYTCTFYPQILASLAQDRDTPGPRIEAAQCTAWLRLG